LSGLIHQDRSAFDLKLNLVEGPLDLEQFVILSTGRIEASSGVSVDAAIIGASHILCFRIAERVFYEVFACSEVKTESRKTSYGPFEEVNEETQLTFAGQGRYRFNVRMLSSEDGAGELREMEQLARAKPGPRNLGLDFQFPLGESGIAPKTIVTLGTGERENVISAKTAHLYPNENTVVFTETNFISFGQIQKPSMKKEKTLCEA
jgi:Protein of unknown function DUF2617